MNKKMKLPNYHSLIRIVNVFPILFFFIMGQTANFCWRLISVENIKNSTAIWSLLLLLSFHCAVLLPFMMITI